MSAAHTGDGARRGWGPALGEEAGLGPRRGEDIVDVLIPTCGRPAALAVTLACLLGQTHRRLRVVVSDQSEGVDVARVPEVAAVARVLETRGRPVEVVKHLPRRGLAEQRDFLLGRATAPYALFLDDDVVLEPDVLERLVRALRAQGCGFVGSFVNAPGAVRSAAPVDRPPADVVLEPWTGPVEPEVLVPGDEAWARRSAAHFAAHVHHLTERLGLGPGREVLYKVAWVSACVLFDVAKLRAVGGFSFWPRLPAEHCGEDVLAQVRVMARFGGAALAPSGAWHQEVPTTTPRRHVDAPFALDPFEGGERPPTEVRGEASCAGYWAAHARRPG